jgi:hypothetical protein
MIGSKEEERPAKQWPVDNAREPEMLGVIFQFYLEL